MTKQTGHHQHQDSHSQHHSHQTHSQDPFTHQEKVLIEMAHQNQKFEGHHHHHSSHKHVKYQRPAAINTNLGLFALKKLNAMNPQILGQKQKKLLRPSAPGVITGLIHGGILLSLPIFAFTAWKNYGIKSFARPQVFIPLGVIVGTSFTFQTVANYCRELTFSLPRANLVTRFKDTYGEKFLLDVLEPSFRLPSGLETK